MYSPSQAGFMIDVRVVSLQVAAEKFANLSRDPLLDEFLRVLFQGLSCDLYDKCRFLLNASEDD